MLGEMTAFRNLTLEDDLATEATSEVKREFVNGEIVSMAGAEPEHNAVREQLSIAVGLALRGRGCQRFGPVARSLFVLATRPPAISGLSSSRPRSP